MRGAALEDVAELLEGGLLLLAVAAAEDGHLAALAAELAGEHLDHGGLAGAADGHVAHADDLATERKAPDDAGSIEVEAELDHPAVGHGKALQRPEHELDRPFMPLVVAFVLDEGQDEAFRRLQ